MLGCLAFMVYLHHVVVKSEQIPVLPASVGGKNICNIQMSNSRNN